MRNPGLARYSGRQGHPEGMRVAIQTLARALIAKGA